jgi:hypothetical protein
MAIETVKWADDGVHRALERELRTGLQLKKATEQRREIEAAAEAQAHKNQKAIAGLGKVAAVIPSWEFFRLKDKYGYDEIHSKEFIRNYQRRFPHLAASKV